MSKFFSFPSERFSDTYHTNSTILNNIDSNIKTIILIKCIYCIISKNSPTELLFFFQVFYLLTFATAARDSCCVLARATHGLQFMHAYRDIYSVKLSILLGF